MNDCSLEMIRLKTELASADAVIVGAGAGLAAGPAWDAERFERYFGDLAAEYGIRGLREGMTFPFPDEETAWAWRSRYIWYTRYAEPQKPVFQDLYELLDGRGADRERPPKKNYFVLAADAGHLFREAGFDRFRLYCPQGDSGLFQCAKPCHQRTYDNRDQVREMLLAQGFAGEAGSDAVRPPENEEGGTDFDQLSIMIPPFLVPRCPVCGGPMTLNLRTGDHFAEDRGRKDAAGLFRRFLERNAGQDRRVLYLEIGAGGSDPAAIRYPFWKRTYEEPGSVYACLDFSRTDVPDVIRKQSVCIGGDIGETVRALLEMQRPC